jgi:hypothetical protein
MDAKSITIVRAVTADFFFDCMAAEVPCWAILMKLPSVKYHKNEPMAPEALNAVRSDIQAHFCNCSLCPHQKLQPLPYRWGLLVCDGRVHVLYVMSFMSNAFISCCLQHATTMSFHPFCVQVNTWKPVLCTRTVCCSNLNAWGWKVGMTLLFHESKGNCIPVVN